MYNFFRDSCPMLGPMIISLSKLSGKRGKDTCNRDEWCPEHLEAFEAEGLRTRESRAVVFVQPFSPARDGRPLRSQLIHTIHTYIQEDLKQLRLLVEKVVSCREAPRNLGVPSEEIALLQELADVKEENGKLKEEQLRAAAAAEAAEAARLAQLAAQKPGELSAN
jgi:hypothetical protein